MKVLRGGPRAHSAVLPASHRTTAPIRRVWSSSSSSSSPPRTQSLDWPLLKRRNALASAGAVPPRSGNPSFVEAATPTEASALSGTTMLTSRARQTHLVVDGLSPNICASDFYRLAPGNLSSWRDGIVKVQQQRDTDSLAPSGRYLVSFYTAEAATAYSEKLRRLQGVSHHAALSATGLWESTLPPLLKPNDGRDVRQDLQALTLAPGSLPDIDIKRRATPKTRWVSALSALLERHGHDPNSCVVLLRVHPPTLRSIDLGAFVKHDGRARHCAWNVSRPIQLPPETSRAAADAEDATSRPLASAMPPWMQVVNMGEADPADAGIDHPLPTKVGGWQRRALDPASFVVVFADDTDAWRFQRHWNQRTLTHGLGSLAKRYSVQASVISW